MLLYIYIFNYLLLCFLFIFRLWCRVGYFIHMLNQTERYKNKRFRRCLGHVQASFVVSGSREEEASKQRFVFVFLFSIIISYVIFYVLPDPFSFKSFLCCQIMLHKPFNNFPLVVCCFACNVFWGFFYLPIPLVVLLSNRSLELQIDN
jgi:hypothetical protein